MLKDWTNIQNLNHEVIPIIVNTIEINDLLCYLDTKFNYIQIDVEGLEADLIASINDWSHFDDCKMICFEQQMTNNITQNIKSQLNQQGNFITMYSTPHNVFCVNKKHLARDHFITNK